MQLSHYNTYGIIALQELRKAKEGMAVPALADVIGIDYRYCQQVLRKLMMAGLVKSSRGGRGGFTLVNRRKSIRVLDVILAMHSPKEVVMVNDRARGVAQKVNDAMTDALRRLPVDSL